MPLPKKWRLKGKPDNKFKAVFEESTWCPDGPHYLLMYDEDERVLYAWVKYHF